ncbi:MAG: EF-P beta-lysylation protein EpmB [Candidatus Contendobacter odensis]|uniref:L-lysine 2,3-aminomutase n=1 Tax=Candidatus Contendibacter odensensis TaxID=1400860 RepID=A0A2G6PFU4_9GAMM|nr:MAG: EF-P beta-lysylation protein EpmB [Candidatus Contendobacter odensis]
MYLNFEMIGKKERIIPAKTSVRQESGWQQAMANAIRDPAELLKVLHLDPESLPIASLAATQFSLRVPRGLVAQMRQGDPNDPLLRQVWPRAAETADVSGFVADPVGDQQARTAPGVLHKYQGRALLIVTGACAVHCRYCFRREYPYSDHAGMDNWQPALAYLKADASIDEIILSGGDPLSLSNQRLSVLLAQLAVIPHLQRLRIHTRQPVVLPERVDGELLTLLMKSRLQKIIVIHANHPREISAAVSLALSRLSSTGATLLNQSVLLRGVNDCAETLAVLSKVLFTAGVLPYYLHALDRVRGSAHFEVKEKRASAIMEALRQRLPGYLVPRFVREQPDQLSKIPIN